MNFAEENRVAQRIDFLKRIDLSIYRTILFDCDGVILNSNSLKTEAFFEVARKYSNQAAYMLRDYHLENGGISRNVKFKYFVENLLGISKSDELISEMIIDFSRAVSDKLLSCEMTSALSVLKSQNHTSKWAVISGGNQAELRSIFQTRQIDHYFELGIYGSPTPKDEIMSQLSGEDIFVGPILYIGDSEYDFQIASEMGIDFVFISEWTEFKKWRAFCSEKSIPHVRTLAHLVSNQTK